MHRIPDLITITVMICFFYGTVHGQTTALPGWELGGNAGVFIYQGDLAPSAIGSYKTARTGLSLYGNRILSNFFALRTNLTIAGLAGDDTKYPNPAWRVERALNFRTSVFEISETWYGIYWEITPIITIPAFPPIYSGASVILSFISDAMPVNSIPAILERNPP
jgi:hypothetical protein